MDLIEKRGIHRVRNGWWNEHSAVLSWGSFGFVTVPESYYRTQQHDPAFEELHWKENNG